MPIYGHIQPEIKKKKKSVKRNKVNREIKLKVFRLPLSTVAVFPLYSPHRHSVCLTFSLL